MLKRYIFFISFLFAIPLVLAKEDVSFLYKAPLVGKALLQEQGFVVQKNLGVANFSPELRLPIQLIYESRIEKSGIFGFAFRSPQLESKAYYDKEKVVWLTPWGEEINFFPKNEKVPKDTIKIDAIEEAKKGKGCFAPYQNWEAFPLGNEKLHASSGDWEICGKRDFRNWKFTYREARLREIKSPSGRNIYFVYEKNKLIKIVQENIPFVEIEYNNNLVVSLKINGLEMRFNYREEDVAIKPKTNEGEVLQFKAMRLISYKLANLNPVVFAYLDSHMSSITQGGRKEEFYVDIKTGRILKDQDFQYSYDGENPNTITLTNAKKEIANVEYDDRCGILKIKDFTGKELTISYFMRLDVAYLGKVREIKDYKGRVLEENYFDKHTGCLIRKTNCLENDIDFEYDKDGLLSKVFRRASSQNSPEPIIAINRNNDGLPIEISQLDEKGLATIKTHISYNNRFEAIEVFDGQKRMQISYTLFGYPKIIKNTFGQIKAFNYDKYNRLISEIDPFGITTYFSYNDFGEISKIESKENNEVINSKETMYDKNGFAISIRNHKGCVRNFSRDNKGQIIKEQAEDGSIIQYQYDLLDNLIKVIDENSNEIKFMWSKFGLSRRTTPVGQITDYIRDEFGLIKEIVSSQEGQIDRRFSYEYDKYDRPIKIIYGKDEIERITYDEWGRIKEFTRGNKKVKYKYDYFGRIIEKEDGETISKYTYNAYGQRTLRITKTKNKTLKEIKKYDRYGRLSEIISDGKKIRYKYNLKNQLVEQNVDGILIQFEYTKRGQLLGKYLGGKENAIASLTYDYAKDGTIIGREINGAKQKFKCDKKGQLISVSNENDEILESYTYDLAGNMIEKVLNGKKTIFTHDAANQLTTMTEDGKTISFSYDAAGRMIREGSKRFKYGYLDKVISIYNGATKIASFDYYCDGQIAKVMHGNSEENFVWDKLALIARGEETLVNEPYVTGGNPILSSRQGIVFNDALGSTIGSKLKDYAFIESGITLFGQTKNEDAFFIGKPNIKDLGYSFLFRNYRSSLAKWQTSDPLGYIDGWNNTLYCGNDCINKFDFFGAWSSTSHSLINTSLAGSYVIVNWRGSEFNARDKLDDGSKSVDSVWNQVFGAEYEHGMRSANQTEEDARNLWLRFITDKVKEARDLSDVGRATDSVSKIKKALEILGKAVHAFSDSYSPSHTGFQIWDPNYWLIVPMPGVDDLWDYIRYHTAQETNAIFMMNASAITQDVVNKFYVDFLYIIREE